MFKKNIGTSMYNQVWITRFTRCLPKKNEVRQVTGILKNRYFDSLPFCSMINRMTQLLNLNKTVIEKVNTSVAAVVNKPSQAAKSLG